MSAPRLRIGSYTAQKVAIIGPIIPEKIEDATIALGIVAFQRHALAQNVTLMVLEKARVAANIFLVC